MEYFRTNPTPYTREEYAQDTVAAEYLRRFGDQSSDRELAQVGKAHRHISHLKDNTIALQLATQIANRTSPNQRERVPLDALSIWRDIQEQVDQGIDPNDIVKRVKKWTDAFHAEEGRRAVHMNKKLRMMDIQTRLDQK